jgi:hypothetical protein
MATTELGVPTHAELVARARDLQPLLRKHVADGEVYRRQADEVIEALTTAGLFRLFTPRRFGGYSTSLRTQVDVTEALAEADGSGLGRGHRFGRCVGERARDRTGSGRGLRTGPGRQDFRQRQPRAGPPGRWRAACGWPLGVRVGFTARLLGGGCDGGRR